METLLEFQKATFNDPNHLGDTPTPSRVITGEWPMFKDDSAKVVFDYTVPAGKILNLKSLLLNVIPPRPLLAIAGGAWDGGIAYLLVDGTTKFEGKLHTLDINGLASSIKAQMWNARSRMSLGEGIDFTQNQVIKVQYAPVSITTGLSIPTKLSAILHGKATTGGAVTLENQQIFTPASGVTTDVLSYTVGANGFRLFSWELELWSTNPYACSFVIYVNGVAILEIGYVTHEGYKCSLGSGSGGIQGVLEVIAGDNLYFNHGDRITVLGHASLDFGQAAIGHLAGTLTQEHTVRPRTLIGV